MQDMTVADIGENPDFNIERSVSPNLTGMTHEDEERKCINKVKMKLTEKNFVSRYFYVHDVHMLPLKK